jgi:hypothetical protein
VEAESEKGTGDAAIEGALEVGDGGGGEEEAGFGWLGISVWGVARKGGESEEGDGAFALGNSDDAIVGRAVRQLQDGCQRTGPFSEMVGVV